jgi:hypothetical protein
VPEGKGVWDVGASERRAVMAWIGVDAPPRKGADFRQVLDREKGAERLNRCGYLDDASALKAQRALCVSSVQSRIAKAADSTAGCFTAPFQGLSPVRGNLHAGFLGEGWAVRPAPYPTTRPRFALHGAQRLHFILCGRENIAPWRGS